MQVEERVAKIEGIVEQMNERLNHIETDIGTLHADLGTLREEMKTEIRDVGEKLEYNTQTLREKLKSNTHLRGEMKDLRGEMRSNFKWTMGFMITMWVTIILAIVFCT
jgi:regulator of replication initiation timing